MTVWRQNALHWLTYNISLLLAIYIREFYFVFFSVTWCMFKVTNQGLLGNSAVSLHWMDGGGDPTVPLQHYATHIA